MSEQTTIERVGQRVLDAEFLERLAQRLSTAIYYDKVGPVGVNGNVSTGLRNDDYDRLREIGKRLVEKP